MWLSLTNIHSLTRATATQRGTQRLLASYFYDIDNPVEGAGLIPWWVSCALRMGCLHSSLLLRRARVIFASASRKQSSPHHETFGVAREMAHLRAISTVGTRHCGSRNSVLLCRYIRNTCSLVFLSHSLSLHFSLHFFVLFGLFLLRMAL